MSVDYVVKHALSLPLKAFDEHDLASVVVAGRLSDGVWTFTVLPVRFRRAERTSHGQIQIKGGLDRSKAVDVVFGWIRDQVAQLPLGLTRWKNLNDDYGPHEAPVCAGLWCELKRR